MSEVVIYSSLDAVFVPRISIVAQLINLILFLLAPSTASRIALLPLNLSIYTIATGRGYIHAQSTRAVEEKARRAKVFRSLGFESSFGSESTLRVGPSVMARTPPNASEETMVCPAWAGRSMDGLGGIRVTKTVVQTSV